ncbi:tetraacyldisaccharide 4'-kinase [Paroceanicella profunda]|uniref:Tetraacyldisaccharide 4'-kinase n=1 Tax=Paroceanicella profunda TaxID=2579971 RepID=A0A5B8FGB7_9RHOB|nr:tetraacyldisaccharide 4'-kinase [Paroceanicella profunda]QDL90937.1 tetraacyldisaccharide 4'-kinase [Paroceanicella profunda]
MRTPSFWYGPRGLLASLLAPLGAIYAAATARRLRRPGQRMAVPVICVGNINAGGTGKTPTVIALAERLSAAGHRPHVVSRGHGGRVAGPVQVDFTRHAAEDVGDEPLLIAAFAPTWVARDRAAGARAAVSAGAGVILLDDGFQNPAVAKDLSIVVVDAVAGFGNGLCIPAGPLREPVATGLARADLVLAIGSPRACDSLLAAWPELDGTPLITGRIQPRATGTSWTGQRVVAFAGIGHPEKFFATLRGLGADLVATHGFPDHAPYTSAALTRLEREARQLEAMLVTTDKDAVRLPAEFRGKALPLPISLAFRSPERIDGMLNSLFPQKQ